jgi:hypothetical protein
VIYRRFCGVAIKTSAFPLKARKFRRWLQSMPRAFDLATRGKTLVGEAPNQSGACRSGRSLVHRPRWLSNSPLGLPLPFRGRIVPSLIVATAFELPCRQILLGPYFLTVCSLVTLTKLSCAQSLRSGFEKSATSRKAPTAMLRLIPVYRGQFTREARAAARLAIVA